MSTNSEKVKKIIRRDFLALAKKSRSLEKTLRKLSRPSGPLGFLGIKTLDP